MVKSLVLSEVAALRRDLRHYHAGEIALPDEALERRLFGAAAREASEPLGDALLRLGMHKMIEDPPRYAIVRAALGLLPRPDLRLLDIGCGRGRVLLYAALLGARQATGIEILETRAAIATAAAQRLNASAVKIVQGDAIALPWPRADALFVMNPFYPAQYRRLRARLIDYARGGAPLIVALSTLRDRMAADRAFELRGEAAVGWVGLAAFQVRH